MSNVYFKFLATERILQLDLLLAGEKVMDFFAGFKAIHDRHV
jgi:tRNA G37 N-methylase Trm5